MTIFLPTPRSLLGGRYRLGEPIGAGGMGVVYAATQAALSRRVAVKVLRPELLGNPTVVEHFRREALAASRVTHPSLVAIIDVGHTDEGAPYLVMEYVPGRPLGEVIGGRPIDVPRALRLTDQLLAGLAESHRRGVVHADVKTDNLLVHLDADGQERIKLIDFGLANIDGDVVASEVDGERAVAGTPEFMAPEVIRGGTAGVAADLYGAGVVLYELLTGTTPFGGGKAAEIMARHVGEPVMPPSLRRPDRGITPALDAVVVRTLAKAPADRHRSAVDLAAALTRAAEAARVPAWCHECGATIDDTARRCWSCGAPVPAMLEYTPSGPSHITGVRRAPEVVEHERELRRAIGDAIRAGACDRVADGYLELARHLAGRGHLIAAIDELREGLDLVSAGGNLPACAEAERRLGLALARLDLELAAHHSDASPTLSEAPSAA